MQAGRSLAHYNIIEKIGSGGMGEVWRANDTRLDRQVALKFLPPGFTSDPARHARFHTEAQALAAFSHPHVAGVHSLEEVDNEHFLVMELVAGEDLSDRIQAGRVDQTVALRIAQQIALALEAAHEKKIIHRDLKPANVKVTADNEVKVLDFGLAKIYGGATTTGSVTMEALPTVTSNMTAAGAILGTAAYMSPEQARGGPLDKRSDIWAFGCVLFEMLTGQRAFPGATVSDTLANVLRGEPDWPELPSATHPAVLRLLKRCLQKDPRQRLHDIADARLEIEDVLDGKLEPEAAAGQVQGRLRKRHVVLAAVGWLLLAGLAATHWLNRPAPTTPVMLRTLTFSGRDWAPSASPDGKTIAFVSDRDGTPRIWLKQLATGNEAALTEGFDDRPLFSPDGSQILFVRDENQLRSLYRTAVVGGSPRKLMDNVVEAAWSPDGNQVTFLRITATNENNEVSIGIADVQTGAERHLVSLENRLMYGLRWAPDGRHLSITEGPLTGNVVVASFLDLIDPVTGELSRAPLTNMTGSYTGTQWAPNGKSLIVGQSADLLAYMTGEPGLVMHYDLASGRTRELFWSEIRVPRGGWGYSTLAAVNDHQIVLDQYSQYAELQLIPLRDGRPDGPPQRLTTSLGRDRQPVFSRDSRQILFSSNRSGNIDLWLLELASGHLRQLTDDPSHDWDPAFTPDGQQIIWSSNRSGNMEIWLANTDGSNARQVSHDGQDAENPTMTADGQWIVYASSHTEKIGIWKVRSDGSEAQLLAPGAYLLPEVSPDGKYALHSVVRGLDYVVKVLDLGTGQHLDFEISIPLSERGDDVVYGRARWSADSSRIVYVGQDENGLSGIYSQELAVGRNTQPTRIPQAGFSTFYATESLGVSPDGGSLVVSAMYNRRILMMAENVKLENWN